MKKVIGQTVRDLKRGVNKKVLKVPTIEQKVLDCTSNEPWGPHGTLLADIAQATRNYHEYQMIMSVLWKRANDTGKNWRHVFKALTVLEYLVAHGSERVIDDIREHAYQLQILADFQYIDSSGRDQGVNVRKKSQGLVALVNDKERILEVRDKAALHREKFRNTPESSKYPPGSYSPSGGHGDRYDDDRYGNRDLERNGSGRSREYGYRGDERYPYSHDGDRYGREYEERYGGDDDYRGRSRSVDNHSSRGRSSEDGDYYSSRGSGARADEQSQDGRSFNHKFSEQNLGAPPSYEEVVGSVLAAGATDSPTYSERDGETSQAAPERSSLPASSSPAQATSTSSPTPPPNLPAVSTVNQNGHDEFDEFDPRGSYSAASTTSNPAAPTSNAAAPTMSVGGEMDLLGSLSDSFSGNQFASVSTSVTSTNEVSNAANSGSTFTETSAPSMPNQSFEDLFGDGPFKAIPSADGVAGQQQQGFGSMSFQSGFNQGNVPPQQVSQGAAEGSFSGTISTPFGNSTPFGASNAQPSQGEAEGSFSGTYSTPFGNSNVQPSSTDAQYQPQEFSTHDPNIDILADILPPTGPQNDVHQDTGYAAPVSQAVPQSGFFGQAGQDVSPTFSSQSDPTPYRSDFPAQSGQPSSATHQSVQPQNFLPQTGDNMSQATYSTRSDPTTQQTGFSAQSDQPSSATHQSVRPQNFLPQTGDNMSQATFSSRSDPTTQQTGFSAQSDQPSSATHQSVRPQNFLPQTGNNMSQATFSSQSDPTAQQTGFSAQSGQTTASTGSEGQLGQLVVHPNFPSQFGQAGFGAHGGQAGFGAHGGQPGFGAHGGQPGFGAHGGQPGFGAHGGQPGFGAHGGQPGFGAHGGQPGFGAHGGQPGFGAHGGQPGFAARGDQPGFAAHGGQPQSFNGYPNQAAQAPQTGFTAQPSSAPGFSYQMNQSQQSQNGGFQSHPGGQAEPPKPVQYSNYNMQSGYGDHVGPQVSGGLTSQQNAPNSPVPSQTPYSTGQAGSGSPMASQSDSPSKALVPSSAPPPAKSKHFETKSTVWADTLSRGLVNLDISGVKTNPLSDIGIDFDSINRKEKRMEKPAATPVTSTIHMGKAMGSGSGMGRAGAGAIRPPPNPMMGSGMDTGMGGPRPGGGMGGYGGMNQQAVGGYGGMNQQTTGGYGGMNQQATGGYGGMNHQATGGYGGMNQQSTGGYGGMNQQSTGGGMGMNMQSNMGMGHQNMGMTHPNMNMGGQMQQPSGFPPGSNTQGGYNQNMGGQMQRPAGFPPGSNMQGGYNPNMGGQMQQSSGFPPGTNMQGGYNPNMGGGNYGQNPYGGSYRPS